jgi:hypothetical protein
LNILDNFNMKTLYDYFIFALTFKCQVLFVRHYGVHGGRLITIFQIVLSFIFEVVIIR